MATKRALAAVTSLAIGLAGCGDDASTVGSGSAVKLDAFCIAPGLSEALRHTLIVVDASAIVPAAPDQFRLKNAELFKMIVGLADPVAAVASGAASPRERVTILAGSARNSTLNPVFTGCLPGVSQAELAARPTGDSSVDRYFGSDLASRVADQQTTFTRQLLIALASLAKATEKGAAGNDRGFVNSPLVKLLRPLGPPTNDDRTVRRLFIFAPLRQSLSAALPSIAAARAAGFKAADEAGLRLGLADAYIVPAAETVGDEDKQFLEAFLLGSQARLIAVGGFSPNGLAPPPDSVVRYRGELEATPAMKFPMELRLATSRQGELVNSWITYTGSMGLRATPLTGQFVCAAERDCTLRSDPAGGLGQFWRIAPGVAPEARGESPFAGLRFFEAKEGERAIKGRIYDPVISIGRPGGGMSFSAARTSRQ